MSLPLLPMVVQVVKEWVRILATGILSRSSGQKNIRATAGFTLIEILVVLLIIAIITGALTFSFDTKKRRISIEASRFAALMGLGAEEAVLKSEELGVSFSPAGYLFIRFQKRQWQPFKSAEVFRERDLPTGVYLEVYIDGELVEPQEWEDYEDHFAMKPHIYLSSSGDFPPFKAVFKDKQSGYSIVVHGDPLDGIKIDKPN